MIGLHFQQPLRRGATAAIGLILLLPLCEMPSAADPETISLDGEWEIAFDRKHTWLREDGSPDRGPMDGAWQRIQVPGIWELVEPDYDGVAWYRKRFRAPAFAADERVRLRFGAVNYQAAVWLNASPVGSHEGGYTPFDFEVTSLLRAGQRNELLVRVLDPGIQERIDGFFLGGLDRLKKDLEIPQGKERRYGLNFGGIWQPVDLLITGSLLLRDVFAIPRYSERSVAFEIRTDGPIAGATVEILLAEAGKPEATLRRTVERVHFQDPGGSGVIHTFVSLDDARPWTPEDPHRYLARVRVWVEGAISDECSIRFGMRDFTYRDGRFLLNGEPIVLKGGLSQGFYPVTLAAPQYPEFAREEIRTAKEANLNLLYLHMKPHSPAIYEAADELGLLIYAEPAIGWMTETPELRARCEREVREMILRDRNHPSIVIWGIVHEGGRAVGPLAADLARLAQQLDPTRVIVPDSGQGTTVLVPFEPDTPVDFRDVHEHPRAPVDDAQFQKLRTTQGLVSETGFGGLFDLPRVLRDYDAGRPRPDLLDYREYRRQLRVVEQGFREAGLGDVFADPRELLLATQHQEAEAVRIQTDARRLSPALTGIIQCFVGNAWEQAGMLDVWRRRKPAHTAAAEAFEPLRLVVWSPLRNGYLGEPVPIEVTLINELGLQGPAAMTLRIADSLGAPWWEKAGEVTTGTPIQPLFSVRPAIHADQEGEFDVLAVLEREGRPVASARGKLTLLRRDRNAVPTGLIGAASHAAPWAERARSLGVNVAAAAPDGATPAVVLLTGSNALEQAMPYLRSVKEHGRTVVVLLEAPAGGAEAIPLLRGVTPEADLAWLRTLTAQPSEGGAVGFYHYIRAHPIFDRLPQRCLIGQPYRNVCPSVSLAGEFPAGNEVAAGAFTTTIGEFRWQHATDLAVVPCGAGRIILTTLELTQHLGRDSACDTLFLNLLRFALQE